MLLAWTRVATAFGSALRTTGLFCLQIQSDILYFKIQNTFAWKIKLLSQYKVIMQKDVGREHKTPESKEIFANGFILREGLCFPWYHGSWIGKSMCGETFDLTFGHNAALFPKTLSSLSLKGESCHCNITYAPPTDGVLFDLILGKASWISSYTKTGFRKPHDTASSHSLPKNTLRWLNTFYNWFQKN